MATPTSFSNLFHGQITHLSHGVIEGWAISHRRAVPRGSEETWIHILVDGQEIERVACNLPRPEEALRYQHTNPNIGFHWEVPKKFFDGKTRWISLRFPDRSILPFPAYFFDAPPSHEPLLPEWIFNGKEETETRSYFEGLHDGHLRGWAVQRTGRYGKWKGQLVVDIHIDGRPLARLRADRQRADVSQSLKQDNFSTSEPDQACGFNYPLPASLRDGAYHEFSVSILPQKIPVSGSPIRSKYSDDGIATRLAGLNNMLDMLQQQLTQLRRETLSLMPHTHKFSIEEYDRWHRYYQKSLTTRVKQQQRQAPLSTETLLSIICPVFHPDKEHFLEAIRSVQNQTYQNWNLILVFDGPQNANIQNIVKDIQKEDSRLTLLSLSKAQGIAKATNKALENATGEYILFLDHDDLLDPNACEVMLRAALKTGAEILYSDEDKISLTGVLHAPHFKPDFNYRYLLGCNYICHLTMYRRSLLQKIGGFEKIYDGAQDHALLLKAYEASPDGFAHVPEILYHWRQTPNSTALSSENKKYAKNNGAKAVRHHFERQGLNATVAPIPKITLYKTKWTLPQKIPSVTIIIPFRDQSKMTERCVSSLLKKQSYSNFSILLIDNWSVEAETHQMLKRLSQNKKVSILRIEEEFNFSRLNNLAAQEAQSEYLLFLNNDVEVRQKDFLSNMMGEILNLPKAGAIGARLLYPSKRIQHGGVAVSPQAIAVHMHRGRDDKDLGYMARAGLSQEVSAVTGAALLTSKNLFVEIGEFDEQHFPIAYNDVDFCLRLRAHGYHIYYCADATAIHHESFSRGSDEINQNERRLFQESQSLLDRWGEVAFFQQDPFYPKNFILEGDTFHQLKKPNSF
ncbi:glycosyltransferase [Acetobacteraceae bacterium]|nr:glycosyltransferase [Acetobacteraceae bacterium]